MSPATTSVAVMATLVVAALARATWRATRGPVWGDRWGEPCPDEVEER